MKEEKLDFSIQNLKRELRFQNEKRKSLFALENDYVTEEQLKLLIQDLKRELRLQKENKKIFIALGNDYATEEIYVKNGTKSNERIGIILKKLFHIIGEKETWKLYEEAEIEIASESDKKIVSRK